MIDKPIGSPTMVLETERLLLRPLELKSVDRIVALANNERVAHMTARMPHPYIRKDARDFIVYANKAMLLGEELALGIHAKEPGLLQTDVNEEKEQGDQETPESEENSNDKDETLIGVCGFMVEDQQPEIGYWVGEPYWGKGFATEAAGAIVDHIKSLDLFDQIHGRVLPENQASIKILERLSFIYSNDVTEKPRNREGTVRLQCYNLDLKS